MNVKPLLLTLAVLAAGYALVTPSAAMAAPEVPADAEFDGMDADHDGRISAAEHADAAARRFQTMDANADGRVTAAEMTAAHKKATGKKARRGEPGAADQIKAVDVNGDGVLSAAEHSTGAAQAFRDMDVIRDGQVSRAEVTAARARLTRAAGKG